MNMKQQIHWLRAVNLALIPYWWHEDRNPEKPDGRKNRQTPKEQLIAVKKLKRGIYAMLKNPDIDGRKDAYETLLERNFIPSTGDNKYMSYGRFYHYWNLVMKEKEIKKEKDTKAQYIVENYKNKSVASIAIHIGTNQRYVRQIIFECERGLRK